MSCIVCELRQALAIGSGQYIVGGLRVTYVNILYQCLKESYEVTTASLNIEKTQVACTVQHELIEV